MVDRKSNTGVEESSSFSSLAALPLPSNGIKFSAAPGPVY